MAEYKIIMRSPDENRAFTFFNKKDAVRFIEDLKRVYCEKFFYEVKDEEDTLVFETPKLKKPQT